MDTIIECPINKNHSVKYTRCSYFYVIDCMNCKIVFGIFPINCFCCNRKNYTNNNFMVCRHCDLCFFSNEKIYSGVILDRILQELKKQNIRLIIL